MIRYQQDVVVTENKKDFLGMLNASIALAKENYPELKQHVVAREKFCKTKDFLNSEKFKILIRNGQIFEITASNTVPVQMEFNF